MAARGGSQDEQGTEGGAGRGPARTLSEVDAITILDNVVRLDQMLDERSRQELGELPYLELSKHLKIKTAG